jgi:4-hydroxybenzoate polyprenyltransferase
MPGIPVAPQASDCLVPGIGIFTVINTGYRDRMINQDNNLMVSSIWKTMRPNNWLKNVFVLAPLFISGSIANPESAGRTALVFVAFCLMSSAVYFLNDILDRDRDKIHPEKRNRPIASGLIRIPVAIAIATVLCGTALVLSILTTPLVTGVLVSYALINIAYSLKLKHVVIADVFCIAIGFVLRVAAGAFAIGVQPTAWIIVATFLLSLFLALAKRRNELLMLGDDSTGHRPILDAYTPQFVDELISVVTPLTLTTYLLYTLDPETTQRMNTDYLYTTGIFVVFGIFRYLYLIHRKNLGGSPTDIVVKDGPMIFAIICWVAMLSVVIYLSG